MANKRFIVRHGLDNSGDNSVVNTITNVAEPVNNSDAATKYYVDTHTTGGTVTSVTATSPVESTGGTAPVISLGTGANGQLVIGTGTGFTKSTLTAGSGVSIANASGSITISATGSGGDVVGPASSTDNAVVRFDGTTGKLIQNSTVTLSDTGVLTVPELSTASITSTGNNPIVIAPDGTGDVHLNADSVRIGDNNTDATLLTRGTGDLILTTNEGSSTEGVIRLYDGANGNITITPNGTGNVGIGTASPSNKLDVVGVIRATDGSIIANTSSINSQFVLAQSGTNKWQTYLNTSTGSYNIYDSAGSSDRLTITTSGNVGIGVTPSAWVGTGNQRAIQISSIGSISSLSNATGNQQLNLGRNVYDFYGAKYISSDNASAFRMLGDNSFGWFQAASGTAGNSITFTQAMTLDGSGNLGIGATTSSGLLTLKNNPSASAENVLIGIQQNGVATGTIGKLSYQQSDDTMRLYNSSSYAGSALILGTNNTERMRIDSSGNVGIGVVPSAWGASRKAIELGYAGSAFYIYPNTSTALGSNHYVNSSGNNIYSNTGYGAALYNMYSGEHQFYVAGSGTAGNTITFTQAMTLTSGGNLGIGTSSPTQKIMLGGQTGATSTPLALQFSADWSNGYVAEKCKIYLYNGGGTGLWGFAIGPDNDIQYHSGGAGNTNGQHKWYTGNTETMRLNASGNLGIGVTPSAWTTNKAIQIGIYGAIEDNSGGGGGIALFGNSYEYASGAYKYLQNYYATLYRTYAGQHQWFNAPSGTAGNAITFTQAMTLDSSGNLGLGTSSPSAKLQVNSSGITPLNLVGSTACQINLNDGTQNANWGLGVGGVGITGIASPSTYPLVMYTNGSERMRITSGGDVGIGTSSPDGKLEVSGKLKVRGTTSANDLVQVWGVSGGSGSYTTLELIKTADTSGNFIFRGFTAGGTGTAPKIAFGNWSATPFDGAQMTLDTSSGNVGIGTSSPTNKLQVNGVMVGNNASGSYTKGFGGILTTTSTSTPTGGSSGDFTLIY